MFPPPLPLIEEMKLQVKQKTFFFFNHTFCMTEGAFGFICAGISNVDSYKRNA